jgi:ubiquinone/menaquinone biosynthesis C-methylase UbiE
MFHRQGPTFWELAEQALSSTDRGYDLLAPKFDYTPFRTPDIVLAPAIARLTAGGNVAAALDVCCGTGAAMQHLRPHVTERLTGIDRSSGMLSVARRKLDATAGAARVEFVQGDALDMPFDEEFDLAVCFGAHGHIVTRDEPRFCAEVHRALRPGGRFGFVTGYAPPLWSPRFWLARGFNAAMRVRNVLIKPEFVMYYLTFLLPRAATLLERTGFEVAVDDDCFAGRLKGLKLVVATKP